MQRAAFVVPAVFVLATACADAPTAVRPDDFGRPNLQAVTSTLRIPIEETYVGTSSCAGEPIRYSLREQLLIPETLDANGGSHFVFVLNDKGTTGLGLTSGTTYHQTGATVESIHDGGPFPFTDTFLFLLNLIGTGQAPDLRLHVSFHVTVNANGDLTALVTNFREECA